MRIAITGGSGFIGTALADTFRKSYDVIRLDTKEPEHGMPDTEFAKCDICDRDSVIRILDDVDLLVHAAIVQIPSINQDLKRGYEVNMVGTQNVCEAVDRSRKCKGMILAGTWHTIGEKDLSGIINEDFGFRPDKVEDRAKAYALSKVGQEVVVRYFDEFSSKAYAVVRLGTVLGDGMPSSTAANRFVEKGLKGEPLTPYKHSMYRPMLYVDVGDVASVFLQVAATILHGGKRKSGPSQVYNVYWPEPMTILELAEEISEIISSLKPSAKPVIQVVDQGEPPLFGPEDKGRIKVDISRLNALIPDVHLKSPHESLVGIVKSRIHQ
jgi:nucleoside-diphosphate-sugar epimerase